MSHGQPGAAGAISLDQLVALNDEMAALVRAGVPLEQGLTELGRDMPGRLGEIAAELGQRMGGGETLPQILAADEHRFPPVWRDPGRNDFPLFPGPPQANRELR